MNFEVGDLVSNQDNQMKVILKVNEFEYEFMELCSYQVATNNPTKPFLSFTKGQIATQPFLEFDRYHYVCKKFLN